MPHDSKGPGVWFPPPLVFVAGFGLAWWINGRMRFEIDSAGVSIAQAIGGGLLTGAGLALMGWGMVTFHRARTAIYPNQPARAMVEVGPYRFTRNPMYLGLTSAYLGVALLANLAWSVVLLPLVLVALTWTVIRREERYLRMAFGDAYVEYCGRVNRWL